MMRETTQQRVLVTGGSGFIGRALIDKMAELSRFNLTTVSRRRMVGLPKPIHWSGIPDIQLMRDWQAVLQGVDVVVHTIARVHQLRDQAQDPLSAFREVNVEATVNLAKQAAIMGVRRFVFISSVKVCGEFTTTEATRFHADDSPHPMDPYAISKMEAEHRLYRIARETDMEVVVIRPPLVYGPGVKANFLSMMRYLHRGFPLPLRSIHNRRSLVSIDNLVDCLLICIDHPAAANQTFLVSDGEDLSISELLYRMGDALGIAPRLFYVPAFVLRLAATMLGKAALAQRLLDSLQVDIGKNRDLLGWSPTVKVETAFQRTAEWFLDHSRVT